MTTSYPDPDDARNAKAGSDHDRAEAWRILALDLRSERDAATALMLDFNKQMRRARARVEASARKDVIIADLKRMVGRQEQELADAAYRLRERAATERHYLKRIRELKDVAQERS